MYQHVQFVPKQIGPRMNPQQKLYSPAYIIIIPYIPNISQHFPQWNPPFVRSSHRHPHGASHILALDAALVQPLHQVGTAQVDDDHLGIQLDE